MSIISKPDFYKVRAKIETALRLLYKNDDFLMTNDTNERAITHKFAEYIQWLFHEWNVDCEYNRRGVNNQKDISGQDTSYPDIIIHHRKTNNNLLIIEAKKLHSTQHSDTKDKEKISEYINDSRYGYLFGLWICFDKNLAETRLDWFERQDGVCREVPL